MAAPHLHYPQPGPSTIPYHPSPPLPYAFGGSPSYQYSHQLPPNGAQPHSPRSVNSASRPPYPQGHGRPASGYHFPFPPHQMYQPGYHPMEHQQHPRPPTSPYPQHTVNGGSLLMAGPSNGPMRPGQYIHSNAPRPHPPPFSPPFHPHGQPFTSSSSSPSALPKQLLMPPPSSSSQTFTDQSASTPYPESPPEHQQTAVYVTTPPIVPPCLSNPSSPVIQYSPVLGDSHSSELLRSESPSLSTDGSQGAESYQVFPDTVNRKKQYALSSRRPNVSDAVAFTVSQAARPPVSYYDSLIILEEADSSSPPQSPKVALVPLTPPSGIAKLPPDITTEPDSPPYESLASSATSTATTATSTGPHTPTPGSPHSSMTSISLPTKSPAVITLEISPLSAEPIAADALVPVSDADRLTPTQESQESQVPTQDLAPAPVKKSWASLLRPTSNGSSTSVGSSGVNKLPVSSVQGFSIPAASPAAGANKTRPNPDLVALLTTSNILVTQLPRTRTRGIVNLGNMCFANTVLQVLVYCPPFNKLFTELAKYILSPAGKMEARTDIPLVKATMAFVKEFQTLSLPLPSDEGEEEEESRGRDSFVPTYVYEALKEKKRFDSMRGGQQEDAEEFLGFYLDTLEEELLSIIKSFTPSMPSTSVSIPAPAEEQVEEEKPAEGWLEVGKKNRTVVTRTHKASESPISQIFGGKFRTALRVPGARETVMVDPWSRLQLDIQPDYVHTIEDALRNIATPGTVQMMSSSRPGFQVDASQQTLIEALPSVLILHLKRFLYDTTVNDVIKLNKKIAFATELEVPKETLAPGRRSRPSKYKLFGVLNHHGTSATGGHYTLDVLHPDPRGNGREGWIRLDDDFVQNIRADELGVRDVGDDRSAYLLFYRRVQLVGAGSRI